MAIARRVVSGRLAKLSTVDRPGNVAWVSARKRSLLTHLRLSAWSCSTLPLICSLRSVPSAGS